MSEKMKQFKLIDMCEQYRDIIYEAEPTSMDYRDFLVKLLMIEEGNIPEEQKSLRVMPDLTVHRDYQILIILLIIPLTGRKLNSLESLHL